MRMIFALLLICNLFVVGWQFALKKNAQNSIVQPATLLSDSSVSDSDYVSPIELLNEGRNHAKIVDSAQTVSADAPVCKMVGPFGEMAAADKFNAQISDLGLESKVKKIEMDAGKRYWLYLGPFQSFDLARAQYRQLQEKEIDSYVIQKGELKNAISLGVFSQQYSYESQKATLEQSGLQPETKVLHRTYNEIWVLLGANEHSKIIESDWANLLRSDKKLQLRQNFCNLDIASSSNFK